MAYSDPVSLIALRSFLRRYRELVEWDKDNLLLARSTIGKLASDSAKVVGRHDDIVEAVEFINAKINGGPFRGIIMPLVIPELESDRDYARRLFVESDGKITRKAILDKIILRNENATWRLNTIGLWIKDLKEKRSGAQ